MPLGTFIPKVGELELAMLAREAAAIEKTAAVRSLVDAAREYPVTSTERKAIMSAALTVAGAR